MAGRRVLITGISEQIAGRLALALEDRDDIDAIVGVDVREPRFRLRRTDFVRADIRNPLVARIIVDEEIDTVAHLSVSAVPGSGGRARMKERNVIGTMQLLAACQKAGALERVIVKSSTAVYGSDHTDPALFVEDATPRTPPKGGFAKDATEVEGYVRAFGRRRKDVEVTILRFANFLGGGTDSLFGRYFSLPVIPTILGFDPRLQFCHPDDAVGVLVRSVVGDHPGIFNVGGGGILYLSQAVRILGRVQVGVPLPLVDLAGSLVRWTGRVDYSPEQLRFLQFGRVGDTTRLRQGFGYEPTWSTRAAVEDYAARQAVEASRDADTARPDGEDLEAFLRGREKARS